MIFDGLSHITEQRSAEFSVYFLLFVSCLPSSHYYYYSYYLYVRDFENVNVSYFSWIICYLIHLSSLIVIHSLVVSLDLFFIKIWSLDDIKICGIWSFRVISSQPFEIWEIVGTNLVCVSSQSTAKKKSFIWIDERWSEMKRARKKKKNYFKPVLIYSIGFDLKLK